MNEQELQKRFDYIKRSGKNDARYYVRKIENNKSRDQQYPDVKTADDWYKKSLQNFANRDELKEKFDYTDEQIDQMFEVYHESYWRAINWWRNKMVQIDVVMAKYKPIFEEAEKIAKEVDVSDITDGFPCGFASVYLEAEAKKTDLGKALRVQYDGDSYSAKVCHWSAYKLPIKMPVYGQCISFSERICKTVADFLTAKGIPTGVYSWID